MNRIFTILFFIAATIVIPQAKALAGAVIVIGASANTGYPRNVTTGGSMNKLITGKVSYVQVFADLAGLTIGGTPAPGAFWPGANPPWPDSCSEPGAPPHSSCTETTYPACLTAAPSVCDLSAVSARMNIISPTTGAIPICNHDGGGNCQAGSQVAYAVARIAAAGPGEISAVIFNPAGTDIGTICQELTGGPASATLTAWKAGVTASLQNLSAAISGNPSVTAPILVVPEGLAVDQATGTDKAYWTYFPVINTLNCIVTAPLFAPGGNSGGFISEMTDHVRTQTAAVGAHFQEYIIGRIRQYLRWSEATYLATHPTEYGPQTPSAHLNNFGHDAVGKDLYRLYLVATAATDTDSDGLADIYETSVSSTNPAVADTDGDGCNDGVELGGFAEFGGLRDPNNAYDWFDLNGDKRINGTDIGLMRARVFQGRPSKKFDATFRRSPAPAWNYGLTPEDKEPWDTLQATSGDISTADLALLEQQRTHRCDCLPDYSDCFLPNGAECQSDRQCLSNACGCGGGAAADRTCQPPSTITGLTQDPRRCTGLGAYRWCVENGDCASNKCVGTIVPGELLCAPN